MANVKITELTAATALAATDVLPIVDVGADATKKVSVSDLLRNLPDGSAASPSLAFADDQNTGVLSPGNNSLAFATSGTQRLVIDSNGRIGVGTASPNNKFTVQDGTILVRSEVTTGSNNTNHIGFSATATGGIAATIGSARENANEASALTFNNWNGSAFGERARIDSSGRVGIGTSSPATTLELKSDANAQTTATIPTLRITNDDGSAVANDITGSVEFFSEDTSDPNHVSGFMRAISQTSAGVNYALTFGTKNNSIGDAAERLRIDSSGRVGIGTTAPSVPLTVNSTTDHSDIAIFHAGGGTPNRGLKISTFSNTNSNAGVEFDAQHSTGAFKFSTGGTERLRIDTSGRLGIGVAAPSEKLHVVGAIRVDEGSSGRIDFGDVGTNYGRLYAAAGGTYVGSYTNDPLILRTNNSERLRIDTSGRLLVGTTSNTAPGGFNAKIQTASTSFDGSISLRRDSNNTGAQSLVFGKSRGSLNGSTIVQSGDTLGTIDFYGADGTDLNNQAAQILAAVDGTPGSNDIPGRLVFSTSADGANVVTERMRIDSSGSLGIGTTSPSNRLHVASTSSTQVKYQATNSASVYTRFQNTDNARGYIGYEAKRLVFYADNGSNTADQKIAVMDADGLKFGSDTASANALDDYEEGTLTISQTGIINMGSAINAHYIKIGAQVTYMWNIYQGNNNMAVSAGDKISFGNPFAPVSSFHTQPSIGFFKLTGSEAGYLKGYFETNGDIIIRDSITDIRHIWGFVTFITNA